MKKIDAIIQPFKLSEVQAALNDIGIDGMTISDVQGHGRQKGHPAVYRGQEYEVGTVRKTRIEIVVNDADAEEVIETIRRTARTGRIGDGKIFVYGVTGVVRIRNDQQDEAAL